MKELYMLLALVVMSAPAYASQSNCPSGCNNPPVSVSFSYDDAEKYFKSGTVPTADQVLGPWMNVASVQLPGYNDYMIQNVYDATGIKNADGSLNTELSFAQSKAFDDSVQSTVLLLNLGSKDANQGPNKVNFTSKGACFAQWSYSQSDIDQSSHFDYICRLVHGNARKMICALNFQVDDSAAIKDYQKVFNGRTVIYLGYVRQ
jgi:hypothetical protein